MYTNAYIPMCDVDELNATINEYCRLTSLFFNNPQLVGMRWFVNVGWKLSKNKLKTCKLKTFKIRKI